MQKKDSKTNILQPNPLGIYIHWPFCRSKCPYCDFFSSAKKCSDEDALIEQYIQDLQHYRPLNETYKVKSIFFGGGTPSLIKPQNIEKIIRTITNLWSCAPYLEISLEANPNSHQPHLFQDLKTAGINRLSLGVQALNEQDLRFLGRTHTLNEALKSIEEIKQTFDNHSIDLIYARPHQQLSDWEKELKQATSFGLKHISLYQLTIEEGTLFARRHIQPLKEEKATQMYTFTQEYLNRHGYPQYEVSNFGHPCIHNLGYWRGEDYIGIGAGAHGRLHIQNQIFATTHPHQLEKLTPQERAEELIIMGLRIFEGIDKARFKHQCGLNFADTINQKNLQQLIAQNLVIDTPSHLRPTSEGMLVLNKIIEELCC